MQPNEYDIKINPAKSYVAKEQPKTPVNLPIDSIPGGLSTVKKIVIRGVITDGTSSH
jgi:hypothetical protein